MILLIDNYDSFTYNLYQYIGEYDKDIVVFRNDEVDSEKIREINPDKIVISPGPKAPKDAGNCLDIIQTLKEEYPILGVCLGHQCIGEAFGGEVVHAKNLCHGKKAVVSVDTSNPIFNNLSDKIVVARYHSLIVNKDNIPECLEVIAKTEDGENMAVAHKKYKIYGLQFHPESILTEMVNKLLKISWIFKGGK